MAKRKKTEEMAVVPVFDDKQAAAYINAEHGAAMQAGCMALGAAEAARQHMANAGKELLRVKESVGHGSFGEWCAEHLPIPDRTLRYYMQCAKGRLPGTKRQPIAELTPSKLDSFLSAESEPEETESSPATPESASEPAPEDQAGLFDAGRQEDAAPRPSSPSAKEAEYSANSGCSDNGQSEPTAEPVPQDDGVQEPRKPEKPFPHSDRLAKWLERVASETHIINVSMGGIKALLAEPDKWNRRDVREYIIPMLDALLATIKEFREEIGSYAKH